MKNNLLRSIIVLLFVFFLIIILLVAPIPIGKTFCYNAGLYEVEIGSGEDYTISKYLKRAIIFLEIAKFKGVKTKELFDKLSFCYIHTDNRERLEKTYSQGLLYFPREVDYYFYRGENRIDLKQFDKAILDYSKVINLDSANFFLESAYYKRGACKYVLGDTVQSQKDWIKAQQLSDHELRIYKDFTRVIK